MTGEMNGDRYADWDGAYVLGGLSASDRTEYERHLADCAACSTRVAELAALPGLLARVPRQNVEAILSAAPEAQRDDVLAADERAEADPALLRHLVHRVRRRRIRVRAAVSGLAALAVAAMIAVTVMVIPPQPTMSESLRPAYGSSAGVDATVDLTREGWGTALTATCVYRRARGEGATWLGRFALDAVDRSGRVLPVTSWSAHAGDTVRTEGSIAEPLREITRLQIRNLDTGAVLLTRTIGAG